MRTAVLTGLRPSTSGVYGNGPDWRTQEIFRDKPTLPRLFRDTGYTTSGAGKIFHADTFLANGGTFGRGFDWAALVAEDYALGE